MMPAFPAMHLDHRLNRLFSFGTVLVLAACLTVAKTAMVTFELQERDLLPWIAPSIGPGGASDPSLEIGKLNKNNFVPWPEVLPEPAAGPEGESDMTAAPNVGDTSSFDPSTLTEGQTLALQQLAARRQELDEREQLLDIRAEMNGRIEAKLDEQISQLSKLKDRIEALMFDLDEAEELRLARLVKIYETMKPKAAAEIFNRLDIPVLIHVVERMKEAKSAAVLGKMDPKIARRVTTELAKRKERPKLAGAKSDGEA
jgi:flagellar motility protein MotE (MotC chaperone)